MLTSSTSRRALLLGLGAAAVTISDGARAMADTFFASPSQQAAPQQPTLDLAAAGMKNTKTTGSMDAGSDRLTVADARGFAVGDQIIVATGGEAGRGRKGTMGVGGGWPKLSGASLAAIAGTTPPAANACAYVSTPGADYGKVLKANGAGTAWYDWDAGNVYFNALLPRALIATITGISGRTLTLSTSATAATENALVVFDNHPTFKAAVAPIQDGTGSIAYRSVRLPSLRDLYFSQPMPFTYNRWKGIAVYGGGVGVTGLCSAPGAMCAIIDAFEVFDGFELYGFDYAGNFSGIDGNMTGAVFGDEKLARPTELQSSQYPYYTPSVVLTLSKHVHLHDYTTKNIFLGAASLRSCSFCMIRPQGMPSTTPTHLQQYALPGYQQWWYQTANGRNNTFQNCWVDNICAMASFEPFQEEGTDFIDCGGLNVLTSFNSSGACRFVRPRILFGTNDQNSSDAACNNPIMQNNANVDTSQNPPRPVGFGTDNSGLVTLATPEHRQVGDIVVFATKGTLPGGLKARTRYYVCAIVGTDARGRALAFRVSSNQPAVDGTGGLPIAFTSPSSGSHTYQLVMSRLAALGNDILDPYIAMPAPCNALTGNARTAINLGPTPLRVRPVDPARPKGYIQLPTRQNTFQDAHLFMAIRAGAPGQSVRGVLIDARALVNGYAPLISSDSARAGLEVSDCGFDFRLTTSPVTAYRFHDNLSKADWIAAYGMPS